MKENIESQVTDSRFDLTWPLTMYSRHTSSVVTHFFFYGDQSIAVLRCVFHELFISGRTSLQVFQPLPWIITYLTFLSMSSYNHCRFAYNWEYEENTTILWWLLRLLRLQMSRLGHSPSLCWCCLTFGVPLLFMLHAPSRPQTLSGRNWSCTNVLPRTGISRRSGCYRRLSGHSAVPQPAVPKATVPESAIP